LKIYFIFANYFQKEKKRKRKERKEKKRRKEGLKENG
jgi:hypothetical protein